MNLSFYVTFKPDNNVCYGQDFSFLRGVPPNIRFAAYHLDGKRWKLVAPGYGGNPYGNGCLYITA